MLADSHSRAMPNIEATAAIAAAAITSSTMRKNPTPRQLGRPAMRMQDGIGEMFHNNAIATPPAEVTATTAQGGHFQTVSRTNAVSASAKSRGSKTAEVHTGL